MNTATPRDAQIGEESVVSLDQEHKRKDSHRSRVRDPGRARPGGKWTAGLLRCRRGLQRSGQGKQRRCDHADDVDTVPTVVATV